MKIFNSIFIFSFVLFAVLQYNDPDPYVWIPIYLFAAYLCWRSYRKQYKPLLFQIALVVFILYDFYLFFDKTGVLNWAEQHQSESIVQTMRATKPWIEETREFFGLLIIIIVLVINMMYLRRLKTKPA